PTFFSQRVTVPSVTLSPSAGRTTDSLIVLISVSFVKVCRPRSDGVERLARELEHGLADGLVLGGVAVDEGRDVLGVGLPVDDELSLADEFADSCTDHVHSDDGAVVDAHGLDRSRGAED